MKNLADPALRNRRLPDPLGGFFKKSPVPANPGALLDMPAARRWMDLLAWGFRNDLYTYQQVLDGRSGPWVRVGGRPYIMASSYDYLGLIGHPALDAAAMDAVRRFGTGTGGVRVLTGTNGLHCELESELARFKGAEAALVYSSGFAANVAVLQALLGPEDLVVSDERIHRSVVDGCRLARVPVRSFAHNDPEDLRRKLEAGCPARTLVIIEGVYSMDGDIAPLPEILALKKQHRFFLMVDESHSLGILGATGRGLDEHWDVRDGVDIWTGSLSKAIPAGGGFVAGPRDLIIYLQHASGPFVFSAALNPAAAGAALAALEVIESERWRMALVWDNGARLRAGLRELGFDTGAGTTPLVPVILGDDVRAFRVARELWRRGILACAVTYPAVPVGSSRLRLCATARHLPDDIEGILHAFHDLREGSDTRKRRRPSRPVVPR